MAQIGVSLSGENVMELVNNLIEDTDFATKYLTYKKDCNHVHLDGQKSFGVSWYRRFIMRNKHALCRARCKPRNIIRFSWCTVEIFKVCMKALFGHGGCWYCCQT
jgi:hypothetical protein